MQQQWCRKNLTVDGVTGQLMSSMPLTSSAARQQNLMVLRSVMPYTLSSDGQCCAGFVRCCSKVKGCWLRIKFVRCWRAAIDSTLSQWRCYSALSYCWSHFSSFTCYRFLLSLGMFWFKKTNYRAVVWIYLRFIIWLKWYYIREWNSRCALFDLCHNWLVIYLAAGATSYYRSSVTMFLFCTISEIFSLLCQLKNKIPWFLIS